VLVTSGGCGVELTSRVEERQGPGRPSCCAQVAALSRQLAAAESRITDVQSAASGCEGVRLRVSSMNVRDFTGRCFRAREDTRLPRVDT